MGTTRYPSNSQRSHRVCRGSVWSVAIVGWMSRTMSGAAVPCCAPGVIGTGDEHERHEREPQRNERRGRPGERAYQLCRVWSSSCRMGSFPQVRSALANPVGNEDHASGNISPPPPALALSVNPRRMAAASDPSTSVTLASAQHRVAEFPAGLRFRHREAEHHHHVAASHAMPSADVPGRIPSVRVTTDWKVM